MFAGHEILDLVMGLISALVIIFVFRSWKVRQPQYFYIAYVFVFFGHIFSIVEGVIWMDFFNLLEHLSDLFVGLFFYIGCKRHFMSLVRTEEG